MKDFSAHVKSDGKIRNFGDQGMDGRIMLVWILLALLLLLLLLLLGGIAGGVPCAKTIHLSYNHS